MTHRPRSAERRAGDDGAGPAPDGASVDIGALDGWLRSQVDAVTPPVRLDVISAGRSNLAFRLTDSADRAFVLRRPPLAVAHTSAHDVLREWRIVSALSETTVPTANPVAVCDRDDVIGAPFYLVDFVPGVALTGPDAARLLSPDARRRAAGSVVRTLSAIHRLDVDSVGLSDWRRSGSLVERQLRRWRRQLDGYSSPAVPALQELADRLDRFRPRPQAESIVHGDFKLANMIVAEDGELAAVVDWELSAVGDPLVDLGWLVASWHQPADRGRWITDPPTLAGGFPGRDELIEQYAKAGGVDVSDIDYYVAFSFWRWSCINEGIRARFGSGAMGDRTIDLAAVAGQIEWQTEQAARLLGDREAGINQMRSGAWT